MSKYEKLVNELKNQDWSFEYSDDNRLYRKGVSSLNGLIREMKTLPKEDAKSLWEQYAGVDYKKKFELLIGES